MTALGWLQIVVLLLVVGLLTKPLGTYMARVFQGQPVWIDKALGPLERLFYRVSSVDPKREMSWKKYAMSMLAFSVAGFLLLYLIQRIQGVLPGGPSGISGVRPDTAFNTAASFITNTNWQAYAGESTMSYLSQMLGLTVQNFLAPATGLTVIVALIRGFKRKKTNKIGNFWVDLTRSILWVLIPLSIVLAVILMWQGSIQNLSAYKKVTTVAGAEQTLPMGPTASQESIKDLGTNGGGFFNANSAHPYEGPTPLANEVAMLGILVIGAGLCVTFGKMVGSWKQGAAILVAMLLLLALGLGVGLWAEAGQQNPRIAKLGVSSPNTMEGKEVRLGVPSTMIFVTVTTDSGCGSVNASHDSLTPIGGMVPMLNMMLGEVIFGGTGTGLGAMLVFVLLTVFIVGLMVGRTPEYLGKKVESWEMKMAILVILIPSACILIGAAIGAVTHAGTSGILNPGPHGLSEILYAYSSSAGNNGSAFAGLASNTAFYNVSLGIVMLIARFGSIVPLLAIAGSIAPKQPAPLTSGTFRTDTPSFPVVLSAVVLIVGALTFFAALALGPIVEHLLM